MSKHNHFVESPCRPPCPEFPPEQVDELLAENATLRAELAEQKAFGRQLFEEKKLAMELLEAARAEVERFKKHEESGCWLEAWQKAESESTRLKAERDAANERSYRWKQAIETYDAGSHKDCVSRAQYAIVTGTIHATCASREELTRLREREKALEKELRIALKYYDSLGLTEPSDPEFQMRDSFRAALSAEPEGKEKKA